MIRAVVAAVTLVAVGCGASDVEIHARAALATQTILEQAHAGILEARTEQGQAAIDAHPDREGATAARDAVDVRFEPVVASYEAVRVLHDGWIRLIVIASTGRPFDIEVALGLAHDIVAAFAELRAVAARIGIELPDLGGVVNSVIATATENP